MEINYWEEYKEFKQVAYSQVNKTCNNCEKPIEVEDNFCEYCGYPTNGSEDDLKRYRWRLESLKNIEKDVLKKVKQGRNTLYIVGVLNLVAGLFSSAKTENPAFFISGAVLAIFYLLLGQWSFKKPFPAMLTGLIVYGLLQTYSAILEPTTIISGAFIKIFVVVFLVKGIQNAKKVYDEIPNEIGPL